METIILPQRCYPETHDPVDQLCEDTYFTKVTFHQLKGRTILRVTKYREMLCEKRL